MPMTHEEKLILLFGTTDISQEQKEYFVIVDRYHNNMVEASKPIRKGMENIIPKMIAAQEEKYFLEGAAAAGNAEKYLADVKKAYPYIINYPAFINRAQEFAPYLSNDSVSAMAKTGARAETTVAEVVAIEEQALGKTATSAAEHAAMNTAAKRILGVFAGPLGNAAAIAEFAKIIIENHLIHPDNAESMAKYSKQERERDAYIAAEQIMNNLVKQNAPSRE